MSCPERASLRLPERGALGKCQALVLSVGASCDERCVPEVAVKTKHRHRVDARLWGQDWSRRQSDQVLGGHPWLQEAIIHPVAASHLNRAGRIGGCGQDEGD